MAVITFFFVLTKKFAQIFSDQNFESIAYYVRLNIVRHFIVYLSQIMLDHVLSK